MLRKRTHVFWMASQTCALLVITPHFELRQTFSIDRKEKIYRPATNPAVFDVFLSTDRAVDQQRDPFSAIWTFNFNFVLQAHELVSLECYGVFICSEWKINLPRIIVLQMAQALGGLPYSLCGGFFQPLDGAVKISRQLVAVHVAGANFEPGLGIAAARDGGEQASGFGHYYRRIDYI
jgi:hypothetical protein